MPTYDYRCQACGHEFEHFQSISAPLLRKCPSCARLKLERLIGPGSGFLFKGAGFYVTDYRSESYREAAKKDAAPAPASGKDGKVADSTASPAGPSKESAPESPKEPSKRTSGAASPDGRPPSPRSPTKSSTPKRKA
jgi:putative FmdB family regulatory protein